MRRILVASFVDSFIQQVFIEHLLSARNHVGIVHVAYILVQEIDRYIIVTGSHKCT